MTRGAKQGGYQYQYDASGNRTYRQNALQTAFGGVHGDEQSERATIMKRTHLIAILIGVVAIGVFAADASAFYHPGMGRFTSRDPGAGAAMRTGASGAAPAGQFIPRDQYRDGPNLYQYVRSTPAGRRDPMGLIPDPLNMEGVALVMLEEYQAGTITLGEIANTLGLTQEVAAKLVVAAILAKQIADTVERYKKQSKGDNDCEIMKDAVRQSGTSLKSLQKVLQKHLDCVANPASCLDSVPVTAENIERYGKYWEKEIKNVIKPNIEKEEAVLKELRKQRDHACKCWYKPWTWFD